MTKILKSSAKSVLMLLGLTSEVSAADAGIQKKIFGLGTITLVFQTKKWKIGK